MKAQSPFRYPGGKTRLLDKGIIQSIEQQRGGELTFVDACVGGGSVALAAVQRLGFRRLVLNDLDPFMASFWRVLLDQESTEQLAHIVSSTHPSIEQFNTLRSQRAQEVASDLDRAFHALFFNRTTFSGVRSGGPIGGPSQKVRAHDDGDGKTYTVDCRWNAPRLAGRLHSINSLFSSLDEVSVTQLPVWELADEGLMYCDPPYVEKGDQLYPVSMTLADHGRLSEALLSRSHPWVLSYDNTPIVRQMYASCSIQEIGAKYSIESKRWTGKRELIITPLDAYSGVV